MASLILRLIKGSPLTNAEVDGNFSALNTELATKITASSADTLTNKVLDDISNEIGANHLHFKVKATENLVAGDVVKVTGYNAGENAYEVAKMTATTDVAIGIIDGTIAIGGFGAVVNTGLLEGFDTSAFTVGQILYPNGAGGLTATQPTSGAYQAIAFVLRSHAINGAALVEASEPTAVRTSSNTGNTVVLRDASGNFSAGTITAALSGNATTATSAGKWTTARTLSFTGDATGSGSVDGSANVATSLTLANSGVTAGVYGSSTAIPSLTIDAKGRVTSASTNSISVGDGTLTLAVSGTGLSGSQTFTANQGTNATFTVTSNATSANTASTIVARDASGNFSAGTITATLNGNASTATSATTATTAGTVTLSTGTIATINAPGTGTYNKHVVAASSTNFYIEAALATDAVGGTKLPIYLTWRGGYATQGGLAITGPSAAALGGNTILHAGNYNNYVLPLSGGNITGDLGVGATSGFNAISGTERTVYVSNSNVASLYLHSTSGRKYALFSSASGNFALYDVTGGATRFSVDSTGAFNLNGALNLAAMDQGAVLQHNGNASQWYGRILSKNSTSDRAAFIGTYGSVAGVFAHNNALNAWADLYVNTVDGNGGGTVRVPNATYMGGNLVLNAGNYNSYAPTLTGTGASGTWGISISGTAANASFLPQNDTRSTATTPQTINSGLRIDFKQNSTEGLSDGGTYFGQITYRQYGSGTDWSGGISHQLGFTDNGNVWQRSGSGTTWGSWKKMLDSSNYSSYALPLSGGTLTGDLLWSGIYPKIGINDGGADCYIHITDDNPTHDGVGYGGEFWFYGDKSVGSSLLRAGGAAFTYAPTVSGNRVLHAGNYTSYVTPAQYLGTAATKAIAYNSNSISENITIANGQNAYSAGPVTINNGYTVTIADGGVWVVV